MKEAYSSFSTRRRRRFGVNPVADEDALVRVGAKAAHRFPNPVRAGLHQGRVVVAAEYGADVVAEPMIGQALRDRWSCC